MLKYKSVEYSLNIYNNKGSNIDIQCLIFWQFSFMAKVAYNLI